MVNTIVKVKPSSQISSASGNSYIDIYCIPGQRIKGFEFGLTYNPRTIKATSVKEGDIFKGYNTFFNPGTINNKSGSIKDIYDLTIGSGNTVIKSGSFIKVNFNNLSGQSRIYINNCGVVNATQYISSTVHNGRIILHRVKETDTHRVIIPVVH